MNALRKNLQALPTKDLKKKETKWHATVRDDDWGAIGGMRIGLGETEVLGENLPLYHFVHYTTHMTLPGLEPGPSLWEAVD
jgi:hypothetical protein